MSVDGWYLGAFLKHYQCHMIFLKTTYAEQVLDTVSFQYCYIMQPPADTIIKTMSDINVALIIDNNPHQQVTRRSSSKSPKLLNQTKTVN